MLAIAENGLTNGVEYGIIRHNTRTAVRYIWKKMQKKKFTFRTLSRRRRKPSLKGANLFPGFTHRLVLRCI